MLLWFEQLWLVHNHELEQIMSTKIMNDSYIKLYAFQRYMLLRSTIYRSAKPHTPFTYLGTAFNLPSKPLHFLCIQDWHPSQKIELPIYDTPQGCFPASLSKCRFLPQIIILVFTIFTLRPLSSRCFFL